VWKNRQPVLQAALSRHDASTCAALLRQAAHVDGCIKGYAPGSTWDNLELLLLALAGRGEAPLPLSA
jgi:DNA polymerase-3 subunit delta